MGPEHTPDKIKHKTKQQKHNDSELIDPSAAKKLINKPPKPVGKTEKQKALKLASKVTKATKTKPKKRASLVPSEDSRIDSEDESEKKTVEPKENQEDNNMDAAVEYDSDENEKTWCGLNQSIRHAVN